MHKLGTPFNVTMSTSSFMPIRHLFRTLYVGGGKYSYMCTVTRTTPFQTEKDVEPKGKKIKIWKGFIRFKICPNTRFLVLEAFNTAIALIMRRVKCNSLCVWNSRRSCGTFLHPKQTNQFSLSTWRTCESILTPEYRHCVDVATLLITSALRERQLCERQSECSNIRRYLL
jgi:hypothetical protein